MLITLKFLGAALIIASGAMIGWMKAERARNKVEVLQQMERLIGRIQGEIFYRGTKLPELLEKLIQEKEFEILKLEGCTALEMYQVPEVLSKSERSVLQEFFNQIGSVTSTENEKFGLYYQNQCAQLLDKAQKETRTAEKLYIKLGLCCGTLFVIVLL